MHGDFRYPEYVAGSGGIGSGLALRTLKAGYRLNIARMCAAFLLLALTGTVIFAATSLIRRFLLRNWLESAITWKT